MIQFTLVIFFQDGTVFYDTGLDIFINHSVLYADTTLQSTFNYFPLAYLVTLPQIWLYFQIPFRNNILFRLFFKLPIIFTNLLLAWLFSNKVQQKCNLTKFPKLNLTPNEPEKSFNNFELFMLFNPINIYIVGMTNQIDVFPAIFLVLTWMCFKNEKFLVSGIFVMIAFLIKEYAIFLMILLAIAYFKKSLNALIKYLIGNLIVFIPTIGIISIINFKGFLDHAILYQLYRQPIGSSLSSFVYQLCLPFVPSSFKTNFEILINILSFGIIFLMIIVCCGIIYSNPSYKNVILFSLLSFLIFCVFNKVFWHQYLVTLLVLWTLYRIEIKKPFSNEFISWVMIILPLFLLFRCGEFATPVLVNLLGKNFFILLIFLAFCTHIILLFYFSKTQRIDLSNKKFISSYCIILLFIISQILFQWYLINTPTFTLQTMP